MAIHQVVEQDGQKVLVEVPVGSNELWGKYVEGTVPENPSSIIAGMPVGSYVTDDKPTVPTTVPAPYNKEVWITESGTFTAPVTGWYDVLIIGAGQGGLAVRATIGTFGGVSGEYKTALRFYTAGQVIPVTIGAKGIGNNNFITDDSPSHGGSTVFDGITAIGGGQDTSGVSFVARFPRTPHWDSAAQQASFAAGSGFGGGNYSYDNAAIHNAIFYGGGGAATATGGGIYFAGDGGQGAIRLRYYDPNKEQD